MSRGIDMSDEDIQKVAQAVYDMLYNDIQEIKQNIYSSMSQLSAIQSEVHSEGQNTRSIVRSIEGKMYNLRRV